MELPTCTHCKTQPVKKKGKKYCSTSCYQASKQVKMPVVEITCGWCSTKFMAAWRFRDAKYCSKPCSNSATKRRRVVKTCSWCKSDFEVIKFRDGTAEYCSAECFGYARRSGQELRVKLICKNCGDEFEKSFIARNRTFCSKSCARSGDFNMMKQPEVAAKVSATISQKIVDGTWPGPKGYKSGWFHSNKCSADMFYRSSYELRALENLEVDPTALRFETEPFSIEYEHQGRKHRYIPDILVERSDGNRELIEVKPGCMVDDEVNVLKRHAAVDWCQKMGMNHLVWDESSIYLQ